MTRYALGFALVVALAAPSVAFAQTPGPRFHVETPLSTLTAPRGDSLKNGALVGAIIVGASAFTFGMWLCNNLKEEGDPPCWKGSAVLGAAGAGVGALAGAGIDAAFTRRPAVRFRVRW